MTLEREINILREINFGYTVPIELYSPLTNPYPPIPEGHKWRGRITSLEFSHNLVVGNSLTFFMQNEAGEPFMLLGGFKLLPSRGKVDLIELLFANREFSFAEGTKLLAALDIPSRLREDDAISFIGAATETTLAGTDTSGEMLTESDLQDALSAYVTTAEVNTALQPYATTSALATAIASIDVDTWDFESPETDWVESSETVILHGLSERPTLYKASFICKVDSTPYSVGDEIEVPDYNIFVNSGSPVFRGATVAVNSVSFVVRVASVVQAHSASGIDAAINPADWKLVIRAKV